MNQSADKVDLTGAFDKSQPGKTTESPQSMTVSPRRGLG